MNLTIIKHKDTIYYGDLNRKNPIYGSSKDTWLETVKSLREDFKCQFNCNRKEQQKLLAKFGINKINVDTKTR
jgi:hypothetical protein